jgi:type II secretory pathway pseudopilin PulG
MPTPGRQRVQGFTLVEALLAAVILAIVVASILLPFTAGAGSQVVEVRQTVAASLAEGLMEEILDKPFEEPNDSDEKPEPVTSFGPDVGETTRDTFSAMDDYDGYTEPEGSIVDADGEVVDDDAAAGLSRHVTVAYVYVTGQDPTGDPSFLRVVVEVRHLGQPLVTLTRLVHWLK